VLAPSERYATERGQRHKKLTDWARQVLLQTARWLPGRRVIAVGDSSFSAIELLRDVSRHLCMISRLRLDAGLYAPAPPRKPGTLGRPRVKGARLPSLPERLADPATSWHRIRVDGWYGRAERRLHIASGTALWHHPGRQVPIRWVLVRDPSGEKEPQAFLCTDLDADPVDILRWFVRRWRVETTFEEARRHLGLETPGPGNPAAMVGSGHPAHDTRAARLVLARDALGNAARSRAGSPARVCPVVSEACANLQRRPGPRPP
jgi:hypothetical protein